MNILGTETVSLDLLFMTPKECIAHNASHMLKKLINYILDHLDDKQPPPSMQNLWNKPFACGFQAGYKEAYRQWGEEGEERSDEAYAAGIRDQRKQWIAKQMNAKLCGTPMQTTPATVETTAQTNPSPNRQCATLQTEPLDDEGPTSLKNMQMALCVDFSMQTSTKTTEATTQTENDPTAPVTHLDSSVNAAMSSLTTLAQPPSTLSTTSTMATTTLFPAQPVHLILCMK
jgi:hypothetical protein